MKKYFLLFSVAALLSISFIACDDDSTGPDPAVVGSLKIESTPTGATVFIDNVNKGTTNTTIQNVAAGNRSVRLELEGYRDTTFSVTINENQETFKAVTLKEEAPTLTPIDPVRIYETTGTTALQPSGLDLSTGTAKSSNDATVDLIYFTNSDFTVHELRTASARSTSFFVSPTGTNLLDGEDSPLAVPSWVTAVSDGENNYFFAYDEDQHYSKLKIVASGGTGLPGDPAWVEIEGLYNETVDDTKF